MNVTRVGRNSGGVTTELFAVPPSTTARRVALLAHAPRPHNGHLEPHTPALVQRANDGEPARLDKPQRWGIVPTSAFWKRPDVWQIARLPTFVFLLFWFPALDLLLPASIPPWGHGLLGGLGPYLFVGLLERYLRRRMKQRRSLVPAVDADGS